MRTLEQRMGLIVFGLMLVSGSQAAERDTNFTDAMPAAPTSSTTSSKPAAPNDAARTIPDSTAQQPKEKRKKSEPPERPSRELGEEVRKFAEDVKQARLDFIKQRQDLRKRAIEAERDRIRAALKENRPPATALQPDAQQDFIERVAELKQRLSDHREALEEAKDDAKDLGKKHKSGE